MASGLQSTSKVPERLPGNFEPTVASPKLLNCRLNSTGVYDILGCNFPAQSFTKRDSDTQKYACSKDGALVHNWFLETSDHLLPV